MPEGSYRFQVGAVCCTVLTDGYFSYPAPWLFPSVNPADLAHALESRRQPIEHVLTPFTCLLIQTGRNVILVDTGAGNVSPTAGAVIARLEMEGIRPKDVDTVLLTHVHPDHTGGAVDARGRPAFPNARYVLSETEHDFWTSARPGRLGLRLPAEIQSFMQESARLRLDALRFQIELIAAETSVAEGVRAIPAPGHTPGHIAVLVSSDGEKLLNIGDAAAHPLHLEHPEWESGFDFDGLQAEATRRDLLLRATAEDMRLMAFHFPFPSVGRVSNLENGGCAWSPGL